MLLPLSFRSKTCLQRLLRSNVVWLFILSIALLWPGHAGLANTTWTPIRLNATTTWLANTLSGGLHGSQYDRCLQWGIGGIYVAPDGTVYAHSYWDENHKNVGIYKDGQTIGICPVNDTGGADGVIAGDGTSVYYVSYNKHDPSMLKECVLRCRMDGGVAPGTTALTITSGTSQSLWI